ncbi:hypothetical protein Alches_03200 [Alicyclobacillus hesperidum subsp. aegles]|uniref:DUF1284 domain-containing protein n=1 Tax=Alicyclobacillus hesperidum TaxID=89784 RepID=UPI0007193171|nr:DUF1284 domain-containing protein [Alicyclobacillus hesperidum]KRW91716.1 hypothetical protein SD51_07500 [Alicyclobacillus tengchongensis]GLG00281.1 hypothetical protein Alches_03200 [Alicyclobacillus hesperidum subsp. aegles]
MIRLRGHHLLCLLGYRGMGYSQDYVSNMTQIYETLRKNPETRIRLVAGPDDLCARFPVDKPYHCQNASVHRRDAAVLARLGLKPSGWATWSEIQERIAQRVESHDIHGLCKTCSWRTYGVCEEGIVLVRSGRPLPPAPPVD